MPSDSKAASDTAAAPARGVAPSPAAAPDAWRATLSIPPLESPFLMQSLATAKLDQSVTDSVRRLAREGFVVLDLGLPDFDTVAARVVAALAGSYGADGCASDAWYANEDVRAIASAPHLLQLLQLLYQRDPIPFTTRNVQAGAEHAAHADTIHLDTLPRHYTCGALVALEDVRPEAGPPVVYPGSHRLPDWHLGELGLPATPQNYASYQDFVREALAALGYQPVPLLLKRGQVALSVAGLYHGNAPPVDAALSRASQFTHYVFTGCQYYVPMQSDLALGRITRREIVDIRTGKLVPHLHEGKPVAAGAGEPMVCYPRPLPSWVR